MTIEIKRLDVVFSFLMKFFYFIGLFNFLPYIVINSTEIEFSELNINVLSLITALTIFNLFVFFLMDSIGLYNSYLDRISRLVTLIATIIGAITSLLLFFLIRKGWENHLSEFLITSQILLIIFGILGWYFIRGEHGLTKEKKEPLYKTGLWVFLICGTLFLFEYFLSGALFILMAIIFASYPFIIIFFGQPKVVPEIKPRKLVNKYERTTFYNFFIDMIKVIAILATILAVSYDGTVILYPKESITNPNLWIRNLAFVGLFAGLAMKIYSKIKDKFYGLIVIIILYVLSIIQYILVNTIYLYYWWLIAPINGFTIAAVYFFIEQKINKTKNVRAMPGSFYFLILIVITAAILLRVDPDIDDILENTKITVSILGLTYIFGYIREAPKQKSLRVSI